MRNVTRFVALVAIVAALVSACATSPTGRRQLLLFPDAQMAEMGVAAFNEMKQKTPLSKDTRLNGYVECVATAITREVPNPVQWEVRVFDDKQVNAFALPGGRIGVYTGLLKVAENQHQLATVIGHEVGHVLAQHANARMSATFATQTGLQLVEILAGGSASPQRQQVFAALGLGAQVGILLPYGRGQESEADVIGLELMARAGFDPRESVALWRNMKASSKGGPPEFLSTHPAEETRIRDLEARLPEALVTYQQAGARGKSPNCR